MPDARAGEPVDHADPESLGGPGRVLEFFGRPLVDAVRLAVPPHVLRQDRLVSLVDEYAYPLAYEMRRNSVALKAALAQQLPLPPAIAVISQGLVHFEMIPPAGQLDAVVAEFLGLAGHRFQRQIGPL